jgi:hypothetical protein
VKFTGQPQHKKVNVSIGFRDIFQDAELTHMFVKAVSLLAQAVGGARIKDLSAKPEAERWAKEFLVGYALLAIGEARSVLLLLGDQLNRPARVHLRSLYEYEHRVAILLDDEETVLKFRDAFAYEMRDFASRLGRTSDEINAEIERVLGVDDASSLKGTKESTALGGNVRDQMRNYGGLDPERRYIGTFAWASHFSHGSVLALNELAKSTDGQSEDFLTSASADAMGNAILYNALWPVLMFVALISREFRLEIPGTDEIIAAAASVNARLQIVTRDQEERVLKMREELTAARVPAGSL